MSDTTETTKSSATFAGIEIQQGLTKKNYFFLFLNTFFAGILMSVLGILQPVFLKDIIGVSPDFFGSINGLLMNINEVATLTLVAVVGALSDKRGRKILAFLGFILLAVSFFLLSMSNQLAVFFNVSSGFSSQICAFLSFVPSEAEKFTSFAPGLFITCIVRLFVGIGILLVFPQFITMVADYTQEKDRGKGMAFNGLMMGVSSLVVFGALAQILKNSGIQSLFYIISIIALAGAVCTWLFLKERLPQQKEDNKGLKELFGVVSKSLTLKTSYLCTLITRADIIVIAAFFMAWAVKISDGYGMTSGEATQKAAMAMIVMSIASLFAFPIVGTLLDKWGRIPTLILSISLGGAGMLLLSVCADPFSGMVYPAMILLSFGIAGSISGANTLATDASPPEMVGTVLGGLNTMQPIGIMLFMGLGGYMFDTFGPGWAFAVKGLASLLLALWLFLIKNKVKTEQLA